MAERPTACPAWRADLTGWLSAQLPPEREAPLAHHLAHCEACRTEADSLLEVAAVLLGTDPESAGATAAHGADPDQPPAHLGERIMGTVTAEHRQGRRRGRIRLGAGLLVVAAAVTAILFLRAETTRDSGRRDEVAFTVVPAGADVRAVMRPDGSGTLLWLSATGLDPGVTYALWMSPPGASWPDRVPAGTFRPDGEGRVDAHLHCAFPPSKYARVWATTPEGEVALDTKRHTPASQG